MTSRDLLLGPWHLDPLAVACGALALVLWRYSRRRFGCLIAAVVLVAASVASPLGVLAEGYLFSAHMLQHLVLVLVVPPLALLGLEERRDLPGVSGRPPPRSRVAAAWAMGLGAMWLWHAPTLCNAAAGSAAVHRFQELSLLAMGTAFWWPILGPREARRLSPLLGIIYLFTACVGCTLLGIAVTFSPVEVCSIFLHPVDRLGVMPLLQQGWGLTPERDQRIGGLLMWVPSCLIYGAGILGQLARWYRPLPAAPPSHALEHA